MTVRALESLTTEEIRVIAREAAEAGDPMPQWDEPSARYSVVYERCYRERQRELDEQEA